MLSVRMADVGPIGLVRAPPPLTLAAVRELLSDQLADRLPEHGYAFLVGGVAISVGQEANEELYKEGDVFIVANPAPGTAPAARSVHNSPSVTLVRQFVDAFTFMAPDEQAEAVSLLRMRHPSAAALFDRGAPGTASASAAPVPPPPPPAAALAYSPLMPGTPEALPLDERVARLYFGKGGSRAASAVAASASLTRPSSGSGVRVASGYGGYGGYGGGAAAVGANRGLSPRRRSGAPASPRASGASPCATSTATSTATSAPGSARAIRRPASPAERSAERLHAANTISSTIAKSLRADLGARQEGAVVMEGNGEAKSLNAFAWGLRRSGDVPRAAPVSPALAALAAVVAENSRTPLRERVPQPPFGAGERLDTRTTALTTALTPRSESATLRAASASALVWSAGGPRLSSPQRSPPTSVGTRDGGSARVAFGSGRDQRPLASQLASSLSIPMLPSYPPEPQGSGVSALPGCY